jgi:alpha-beta hydrolase superfamily lysophospholipase
MVHETEYWLIPGKVKIFAQRWQPFSEVKGIICLVHGLGEHGSRYEEWAYRFTEHGYVIYSVDLPGHGHSPGKRGHGKYETMIEAVKTLVMNAREAHPGVPLVLYGHSMGGNLVLNYASRPNAKIDGLISTSPWLELVHKPGPFKVLLAKIARFFYPALVMPTGLEAKHMSSNHDEVDKYGKDPLIHDKISAGLFLEIEKAAGIIVKSIYKINVPFLCMHGSEDQVTSPASSQNFVQNTSNLTTLKIWEGKYHELHKEDNKEEVFAFIIKWLNSIFKTKSKKVLENGYF